MNLWWNKNQDKRIKKKQFKIRILAKILKSAILPAKLIIFKKKFKLSLKIIINNRNINNKCNNNNIKDNKNFRVLIQFIKISINSKDNFQILQIILLLLHNFRINNKLLIIRLVFKILQNNNNNKSHLRKN